MLIEKNAEKTSEVATQVPPTVQEDAVQAAPVTQNSGLATVAPDKLNQMLELLIEDRVRSLAESRAKQQKDDARREQYRKNAFDNEKTELRFQAKCRHLKGGKNRKLRNVAEDFNVYAHVFITGETYIKCNGCGMKWRPTDTKEFVARNGKVYKNHTKLGWADAMEMVFKSSNQRSSSEIPPEMIGNIVKDFAPKSQADEIGVDLEPVGEAKVGTV